MINVNLVGNINTACHEKPVKQSAPYFVLKINHNKEPFINVNGKK